MTRSAFYGALREMLPNLPDPLAVRALTLGVTNEKDSVLPWINVELLPLDKEVHDEKQESGATVVRFDVVPRVTDFGWALHNLREGRRVVRKGWNGKGQYLELQTPDVDSKMTLPYIFIRTVQGDLVPWLASQGDMLSEDWELWTSQIALDDEFFENH